MRVVLAVLAIAHQIAAAQCVPGPHARLDREHPVPARSDILAQWQRRQATVHSFRFAWTENQTVPRGWIANPRYAERERLASPSLEERSRIVNKTLELSGDTLRYSYVIDRRADGDTTGNSNRRHYSYTYTSVFDGRETVVHATSLNGTPPSEMRSRDNRDAQNLDTRPILMALRPLDPVLGDLLLDRAVPNPVRVFDGDVSTFLLEERRDPLGWKTILWLEPERDLLVRRFVLVFENTCVADIAIDYARDARFGWVPSSWRVTELLAGDTRRLLSTARVTSYSIH